MGLLRTSSASILFIFLFFPHLSADEQEQDYVDASVDIREREHGNTASAVDEPNYDSHFDKPAATTISEGAEDGVATDGTEVKNSPLHLATAVRTEGAAVLSAAQKLFHDEVLTRFPTHLSDYFFGNAGHDDDGDFDGRYVWAPRDDFYSSDTLASYRNHVVIQPPFRPFSTAEDVRLSMDRLSPNAKHHIRKQQYNKGMCNITKFEHYRIKNITKEQTALNTTEEIQSEQARATLAETNVTTTSTNTTTPTEPSLPQDPPPEPDKKQEKAGKEDECALVDYASKSAGALIIEKSKGWKGISNVLSSDNDQYAIVPTGEENKSLIIGLSEEILVKKIVLSNYERYSCNVKEFQIFGSQTMAHWANFGLYTAKSDKFGRQEFELHDSANWARYLRFRIISHYGDEHYLTITQISVYGSTMQQGFHEQWEEQQDDDNDDPVDEKVQKPVVSQGTNNSTDGESNLNVTLTNSSLSSKEVVSTESQHSSEEMEIEVDLIPKQLVSSKDSAAKGELCSSCRVRGVGNDGYLMFDWILPPVIETQCQWTALSSASVASSTARLYLFGFPASSVGMESVVLLPQKPPLFLNADGDSALQQKHDLIAEEHAPLSRLVLEETAAVADLLAQVQREIDQLLYLGEFKIKFTKPERIPSNNASVESQNPVTPVASTEENSGEKKANPVDVVASVKPPGSEIAPDVQSTHRTQSNQSVVVGEIVLENSPGMDILLARIPSASCLLDLNLTQYKKKSAQARSSTAGSANNNPATGGMEPIFKKLTGEIKSLQASLSVHEKFARDSVSCFHRVLLDLLIEQEKEREIQNRRLENLELFLSGTFLNHAFWDILSAIGNILSPVYLFHVAESLAVQLSEMKWNEAVAWVFENPWRFPSGVGFPLSLFFMFVFRRKRRTKCKLR
ncbi:hypothetical protein ACA910_000769 [Epithemia clementina (nom. ined.)]